MFKNILLAVSGEETSENFIGLAMDLALCYGANLTALHVTETSLAHYGYVDQLASSIAREQFIHYIHDQAAERKTRVRSTLDALAAEKGINYQWKIRNGNPAVEILDEIKAGGYDLVVLGTKPASPGNTSRRVKEILAKNTPCSVFIQESRQSKK